MLFILQIKTRRDAKPQHSDNIPVVLGAASRVVGVNEPNPQQAIPAQHLFGLPGFHAPQTEMYAVPTPVVLRQPPPTASVTTKVDVRTYQQQQQQQRQQQQRKNIVNDSQTYTPLVHTISQEPGAPVGPSGTSPNYPAPRPPTGPRHENLLYVNGHITGNGNPPVPARRPITHRHT